MTSIRKIKPTTPGQRFRIAPSFTEITKSKPEKSLLLPRKKKAGRNNTGRITIRYRGGGHKQRGRLIDFKRPYHNVPATIKAIEYDPTRTARIALLHYANGAKTYILAPQNLQIGTQILSGPEVPPDNGNALPLKNIPIGTAIHNIEIHPGKGAQLVRSAGAAAQLVAKGDKYATIKLPSGEIRKILLVAYATIGKLSFASHMQVILGKAGKNRQKGRRPRTRPVAMNPVDHPMGGGEGKASGGHPRSRNGIPSKGKKTRKKKKYSTYLIQSKKRK